MQFDLNSDKKHLLILGAGASVDYGLPTWGELGAHIEKKVNSREGAYFEHQSEILSWINKVGEGREYATIDQCITKESRSREFRLNGLTVENKIFLIMKDLFKKLYKENDDGWISRLNKKILDSNSLEHRIAIVNYNYDNVLDENLLCFEHLTQKEHDVDYRTRINSLSPVRIPSFYPHGNFFSEEEITRPSRLYRYVETKKSGLENIVDAISCYDSESHIVKRHGSNLIKLHILGLGGGLQFNLGKLALEGQVSEISVTIRDNNKRDEIIGFLSDNYKVPATEIKIFSDCNELIESSL